MKDEFLSAKKGETVKAAAYVRMSTDHQKYSTENQMTAIQAFADEHGYEIVHKYSDEGKSGLRIAGRTGLQQMLKDVEGKRNDYEVILVLDVSRWGRFQNPDEAAHYEYICYEAGVKVLYCAESFANDGSPFAGMAKWFKRSGAADYSKELSNKVFAGQSRLIEKGFRQGGTITYGLRRMLVDENRNPKGLLKRGEHKSIQTDRVIQVRGPEEEVKIVRWMYRAFVNEGKNESQIAALLNARGIRNAAGTEWTRATVREVLSSEKYIGNNIFNRISYKLKKERVKNPESEWVRKNEAFEGIVESAMFHAAKEIFVARCKKMTNEEMLEKLRMLYEKKGWLSAIIIDEEEDMPSSSAYQGRFGGLVRAYQLIKFDPQRDFTYIEINKFLRELHASTVADTIEKIRGLGATVTLSDDNSLLTINDMFTVSIVICRCFKISEKSYRWKVRFDTSLNPDITVAVRMDSVNKAPKDYYLLPSLDFCTPNIRLKEINPHDFLDSYRFDTLDYLLKMTQCISIEEVAQQFEA